MLRYSPCQVIATLLLVGLAGGSASGQTVQVLGSLSRPMALQPGGQSEGAVMMRNVTDSPVEVRMSLTDYRSEANGRSLYPASGSLPRSCATWVTFAPTVLVVAPKSDAQVAYRVTVPPNAELTGTYWCMLMIQPQGAAVDPNAPPPTPEEGKIKVAVRTQVRYAVQMVVNIGDTGTSELKFAEKRIVTQDQTRALELDVANTGERALAPAVWAEFHTAAGVLATRIEAGRRRIYPGSVSTFSFDLTGLAAGKYQTLIVADNGDDNVFGARYSFELQ